MDVEMAGLSIHIKMECNYRMVTCYIRNSEISPLSSYYLYVFFSCPQTFRNFHSFLFIILLKWLVYNSFPVVCRRFTVRRRREINKKINSLDRHRRRRLLMDFFFQHIAPWRHLEGRQSGTGITLEIVICHWTPPTKHSKRSIVFFFLLLTC